MYVRTYVYVCCNWVYICIYTIIYTCMSNKNTVRALLCWEFDSHWISKTIWKKMHSHQMLIITKESQSGSCGNSIRIQTWKASNEVYRLQFQFEEFAFDRSTQAARRRRCQSFHACPRLARVEQAMKIDEVPQISSDFITVPDLTPKCIVLHCQNSWALSKTWRTTLFDL